MFRKLYFYVGGVILNQNLDSLVYVLFQKKRVNYGETCPYENMTVTELNMEANYETELKEWNKTK